MQLDVNQSCRKARQIDYHRTKYLKLVYLTLMSLPPGSLSIVI